jgi:ubiquinone/menaquinone biosynthesis C-methylase UbiE
LIARVLVLGAAAVEGASLEDAAEVVIIDPSPDALLALLEHARDPRYSYLLGELPVLPLPDDAVDAIVGAAVEPASAAEVARVSR